MTEIKKIEKSASKFQGYLWYSDQTKPKVFYNDEIDEDIDFEQINNPFIIEGQLSDGKDSYSIKFIDGKYIARKYKIDPTDNNSVDMQEYLANKMDGYKLRFIQRWKEAPDELCEGMNVKIPAELVFLGLKKVVNINKD